MESYISTKLVFATACISLFTLCSSSDITQSSLYKKVMYTELTIYLDIFPGIARNMTGPFQITCADLCTNAQDCTMFFSRESECILFGLSSQAHPNMGLSDDDHIYTKIEGMIQLCMFPSFIAFLYTFVTV